MASNPKFCVKCIWSEVDEESNWRLRCTEPSVNKQDPYALGSKKINGVSCTEARSPGWFKACGIKGKQFTLSVI